MNWGWKITILYTSFVVFMSFLVYKALHQHFDLVTKDYYEKELQYGQQIAAEQDARQSGIALIVCDHDEGLGVKLSGIQDPSGISGQVKLYRPSDARLDKTYQLFSQDSLMLPARDLTQGVYKVEVSWTSDQKNYFAQKEIYVKP